jgi:hypothetical protein
MAKAKAENNTSDEIWFSEAVALLAEQLGGAGKLAEDLLVKGLGADLVPWTGARADGTRFTGDAAFWNHHDTPLNIDKNSAWYSPLIAHDKLSELPDTTYAIKVSRTAALALLPLKSTPEPSPPQIASLAESSAPALEPTPNTEPSPSQAAKRKKKGKAQLRIAEAAKELWPLDGIVPLDVDPADLQHAIEALDKRKAEARSAVSGKKETPPAPPSWPSCKRFLKDQRGT